MTDAAFDPAPSVPPQSWRDRAACRGNRTWQGRKHRPGVCASCPVRWACLDYALRMGDVDGPMYGGVTADDRAALLAAHPDVRDALVVAFLAAEHSS